MGKKQIAYKRPPRDKRPSDEGEAQPQVAPAPQQEHQTTPVAFDEEDDASENVLQHILPSDPNADHPQTPSPSPSPSQIQPISEPKGGIVLGLRKWEGGEKTTAAKSKRTRLATNIKHSKEQNPRRRELKTSKKAKVNTDAAVSEATSCGLILDWIDGQRSLTEDQKKLLRDNFEALGKSQVDDFESGFRKIRKAELELVVSKTEIFVKFVQSVLNVIQTQAS